MNINCSSRGKETISFIIRKVTVTTESDLGIFAVKTIFIARATVDIMGREVSAILIDAFASQIFISVINVNIMRRKIGSPIVINTAVNRIADVDIFRRHVAVE